MRFCILAYRRNLEKRVSFPTTASTSMLSPEYRPRRQSDSYAYTYTRPEAGIQSSPKKGQTTEHGQFAEERHTTSGGQQQKYPLKYLSSRSVISIPAADMADPGDSNLSQCLAVGSHPPATPREIEGSPLSTIESVRSVLFTPPLILI